MSASSTPTGLLPCTESSNNELIVVEGQSAANALRSVRDHRTQAVLAMQGKAPNANRTSTERLLAHPQVAMLLQCIRQTPQGDDKFRYDRVILLADPDADGLHAGLLLVLLLIRQVPELINQGKLYLLRAPLYGFYLQDECTALAYSDRQAKTVATELEAASVSTPLRRRFKGIASLSEDLRRAILQPECLARHQLTMSGCEVLCRPLL